MTDRFVTVPDSLALPAAVKVGVDRLHDSTVAGRALLTGADAAAQRSSLGLGTAATASVGDFATSAQGTKADAAAPLADPVFTASAGAAPLAGDSATSVGWTLGANWTGDATAGFTHAAGSVEALTWDASALPAGRYLVEFTVSTAITPTPELAVKLGDATDAYIYAGSVAGRRYAVGFKVATPGPLVFTPLTGFVGTVSAVTVRAVTATATPALGIQDPAGAVAAHVRVGTLARESVLIGLQSGQYDTTGAENVALGFRALSENITGFWNTAVGWGALRNNINGSRNVAVGEKTLVSNTTGYRNVAVGQSVLVLNKTGQGNIAIGADAMLMNNSGNKNVAIGLSALGSNIAGSGNVAIGEYAMNGAQTSENVGIGYYALYGSKGAGNTGVGQQAGRAITTGAQCTALGSSAMLYNATGADNTSVGFEAGRGKAPSDANFNRVTTVGRAAGRRLNTGSDDNTAIGFTALGVGDGGVRNTAVGSNAGASGVGYTINRNVLVGYQAGIYLQTGGDQNTLIGTSAGDSLTTGHDNILIGYNVDAPAGDSVSRLNIGSTIYGDLATDHVGIGVESMTAVLHLKAGTATAGTAPLKLTAGTNLTAPEAGAIEFDGTNLYFTTAAGVRKTVAVV